MIGKWAVAKFLLATALCTGGLLLLDSPKASAGHVPIPGNANVPGFIRNYMNSVCGHSGQSPAVASWLSIAGSPTVTSATVNYGQASIGLQFNFVGQVCYSNSGGADQIREGVLGASANPAGAVSGIVGAQPALVWAGGSHRFPRQYRQVSDPFTYAPNGGFRTSGYYTITLDARAINHFNAGWFGCTAPGGGQVPGWTYNLCPYGPASFQVYITVLPPPVDRGSCSISAPGSVYPGQAFNATFTVSNTSYGGPAPGVLWPVNNGQASRYRLNAINSTFPGRPALIEITGSGVTSTGFGPILFPPGHGRPNTTSWNRAFSTGSLGRYTLQYRIWNGTREIARCSATVDVVERPYFRTYGGDIFAGVGQRPTCQISDAAIVGQSYPSGTNNVASGSQLANFALNVIFEFGSAQVRNNGTNPTHLNFANAGDLDNRYAVCAPDYWTDSAGASLRAGGSTGVNGPSETSRWNNSLTITGGNLGQGIRKVFYVDGDVTINGNITYNNGAYNDVSRIPSFTLVARGNIYVAPGVSELNGVFVSLADDNPNTSGRFYTCWPGHVPTDADMNGTCRSTRLTVYGAVIADLIKLTRSNGSAHTATSAERYDNTLGSAAERFIYTPEVWLTSELNGEGEFDSYHTLPPVL